MVDTTVVRIPRPVYSDWEYYNKNKKCHCFIFQVAVSFDQPYRILSFEGPFKGSTSDVAIFRTTLAPQMFVNEFAQQDEY